MLTVWVLEVNHPNPQGHDHCHHPCSSGTSWVFIEMIIHGDDARVGEQVVREFWF